MKKIIVYLFFTITFVNGYAQEAFPVYTDYLSDNLYLIHPSAAGIGNCGKIRLTYRRQWTGVEDAPSLQTLSFHTRIGEKAAIGAIAFNDENGYHAQKGIIGTYAYHLNFGREDALDQLSFGLSFMFLQNAVDQRNFITPIPDPSISQTIETANYYNFDFSMAYHFLDAFSYFTIRNLILTPRNQVNQYYESDNLRRYLLTLGYYLGRGKKLQWEPSVMAQYIEQTGEFFADFNAKVYRNIGDDKQIWAVLSYRQGFEGVSPESLSQITPIVGFNYKRFMVAYTYTKQLGDITFDSSGFHQITLGLNVFCKPPRATGCPNLNAIF